MRPVSGFERPRLQWLFVTVSVVLIVVALLEAAALRRSRAEIDRLRAADLNARLEIEQAQANGARERSAREALSLEITRLRGNTPAGATLPTLTLAPVTARGSSPPEPTVQSPAGAQPIQLRLILPARAAQNANYAVTIRTWSGGDTLWSRGGLRPSSADGRAMVTALVTGDVLVPGAYEVSLTTASPDGKSVDVAASRGGDPPARRPRTSVALGV